MLQKYVILSAGALDCSTLTTHLVLRSSLSLLRLSEEVGDRLIFRILLGIIEKSCLQVTRPTHPLQTSEIGHLRATRIVITIRLSECTLLI